MQSFSLVQLSFFVVMIMAFCIDHQDCATWVGLYCCSAYTCLPIRSK